MQSKPIFYFHGDGVNIAERGIEMTGYFRAYSNRVREATRDLDEDNLRVYLSLLSFANCEGMCWPGIKTLVETTGVCTDGIYSALEALVARGYIIIVRRGTRDELTRQQLPNVYKIDGAVIDDDCDDDEFRTDDPILALSSNEESKHHQRTQPYNTTRETQPENTTTNTTNFREVEVPDASLLRDANTGQPEKAKSPEKAKDKHKTQSARSATPTRSVNPPSPGSAAPPSPRFYRGPLGEYAEPLPDDREQLVAELRIIDQRMSLRTARYLVATGGVERVNWAIKHYHKQANVQNPAGYIRHLIERDVVEEADAEPENPGLKYISGKYAHLIEH